MLRVIYLFYITRLDMMFRISRTPAGDTWKRWLTKSTRETRGSHQWRYIQRRGCNNSCMLCFMWPSYDRPGRCETFAQYWYSAGPQSVALDQHLLFCCCNDGGYHSVGLNMTHWPSVDLVPGRRRRRWTSIELSYYHEYNIRPTSFFSILIN